MKYMTSQELAAKLKCSVRKIHDMRRSLRLPRPVKFGGSPLWVEGEVDEWLLGNRAEY